MSDLRPVGLFPEGDGMEGEKPNPLLHVRTNFSVC